MVGSMLTLSGSHGDGANYSMVGQIWSAINQPMYTNLRDLGCIRRRHRCKDSPRNTTQDQAGEQHTKRGGKEEQEDETGDRDQRHQEHFAIAELMSEISIEESSYDRTDSWSRPQSRLPWCWNLPSRIGREGAEALGKSRLGKERGDQDDDVAFHDPVRECQQDWGSFI